MKVVIIQFRNFDLDVRENLIAENNRGIYAADATTASGNTAAESLLALGFSQGKAYVRGYEVEKFGTTFIDLQKQEILIQIVEV